MGTFTKLRRRLILDHLATRYPLATGPQDCLVPEVARPPLVADRTLQRASFLRQVDRTLAWLGQQGYATRVGAGWIITGDGLRWLRLEQA